MGVGWGRRLYQKEAKRGKAKKRGRHDIALLQLRPGRDGGGA